MDNEEIINSVRLSRRIALAFVISIVILFGFYQLSAYFNDWSWFARSGSILVCIGVVTAAYDLKGRMEKYKAPETYIFQAMIMEASIVVVGTLVWGFGDLLGHFY